jgi:diacylglycerol kinase (ATP)
MSMQAILLHNPGAGNGDTSAEDLLAALTQGGVSARYCSTKSADFPGALGEPADLVLIAGGDGTVVRAIDHLRHRNVPIAILPLGSANNIARSLGIGGIPTEIARAGWQQTETRRLDVGTASGPWGRRPFVEAVGVGVLAEAAAAMADAAVQGGERSRRARRLLCEMLRDAQPRQASFVVDGQEVRISYLLAEIMNINSAGPRLLLAPDAWTGDGLLDFVYLEADGRAEMISWVESSSEGKPPLKARQGRGVAFEWRSGGLHIDDDFPSAPARPHMIEVELLPDPVTVVMPASLGFRQG